MAKHCKFKKILYMMHYKTSFSLYNITIEKPKENPKLKSVCHLQGHVRKRNITETCHGPNADLQ